MGLDFIYRLKQQKPWRKGWNQGLAALKEPALFDLRVDGVSRAVTMRCDEGRAIAVGREYTIHVDGERLSVFDGPVRVGSVEGPPADVLLRLKDGSGVGVGIATRLGTIEATAELRIVA